MLPVCNTTRAGLDLPTKATHPSFLEVFKSDINIKPYLLFYTMVMEQTNALSGVFAPVVVSP